MDLYRILQDLVSERRRLSYLIQALEAVENGDGDLASIRRSRSRRGRKSMDPEERKQVSERMLRYWAERRRHEGAGDS